MKKILTLTISAVLLLAFITNAQIPTGFTKGTITLNNAVVINGYLKENFKKTASVTFVDMNGSNRKQYDATQLNTVTIDGTDYISIKSDFFKTICSGKISFLQKMSNVAGKTIYNGTDPIILPGTEGKIYDYFSYRNNELTHLTKKTLDVFIQQQFADCVAAQENAKNINGDIAALAQSINIYNAATK